MLDNPAFVRRMVATARLIGIEERRTIRVPAIKLRIIGRLANGGTIFKLKGPDWSFELRSICIIPGWEICDIRGSRAAIDDALMYLRMMS